MPPQYDRPGGTDGVIRFPEGDREAIKDDHYNLFWFHAFGRWYAAQQSNYLNARWHPKEEP